MNREPFRLDFRRFGEGSFRIHWRHGVWLCLAFFGSLAFTYAQSEPNQQAPSAMATLILWMPFILKGFGLNLLMSFIAMAAATILGIGLGLLQVSRSALLQAPAWFVTQLFRNSPWLVILFIVMFLVPFEVRLPGGDTVRIPDWIKATFAFSLPVMANVSEILRGAINSIPKGQWDSSESLAFTRAQTLRWIILPQCVRRAIPPWQGNRIWLTRVSH